MNAFSTPILFLNFNRPRLTNRVFDAIRKQKPKKLYIACDGPREGNSYDLVAIDEVKKIVSEIDWSCEVFTLYRNNNLGCKKAVSEAITWFFHNEELGIILEDDCMPNHDFFNFCQELLFRYKDQQEIWTITGNNFQNGKYFGEGSYYFSKYNHVWGWATWRRAWLNYDIKMKFWPDWKCSTDFKYKIPDANERAYWLRIFDNVYNGQIDTWDYIWTACIWYYGGITATPNVNLVSNIGFGSFATHTKYAQSKQANLPFFDLGRIVHPTQIRIEVSADKYIFEYLLDGRFLRRPFKYYFSFRNLLRRTFLNFFKNR